MTPPKRNIPGYIFGSAKAGQTTALLAGRSRIKKLPSAEELLGKIVAVIDDVEPAEPAEADMRGALVDIVAICQSPGRSADKIKMVKVRALAGLAE